MIPISQSISIQNRRRFGFYLIITLVLVAYPIVVSAQDSLPSWTNSSGKTIQAEFIKLDGETLGIRKDGKVFNVPLSKLSTTSQEQAQRLGTLASSFTIQDHVFEISPSMAGQSGQPEKKNDNETKFTKNQNEAITKIP